MNRRTFVRLILLIVVVISSFTLLSTARKSGNTEECPAMKQKSDDTQVQGGMIWESVSRHLLTMTGK
jgi:hypothetical protein